MEERWWRAAASGRGRGDEDVVVERVGAREVDGAVHLEHDPGADVGGEEVDADECAVDRLRGGAGRSRMRRAAAAIGSRRAPRATFVRHSPGAATRRTAPTTRPPATTSRRSKPRGRDELLRDCTGGLVPGPRLEVGERAHDALLVVAPDHVLAPRAEARLEDERRLELRLRQPWRDMHGARVRHACVEQRVRRRELVVRCDERLAAVQDGHPGRVETLERPEPRLDSVERRRGRRAGRARCPRGRVGRVPAPARGRGRGACSSA